MIRYDKLLYLLSKNNLKKKDLQEPPTNLAPGTIARMFNGGKTSIETIDKICERLNCQPGDIMEWVPDHKPE